MNNYQWHCPNLTCPPNYHPGKATKIQQASNRYYVLEKDEHERSTKLKEETARKQLFSHLPRFYEKPTKIERERKKLFSYLPRISSNDYNERVTKRPKTKKKIHKMNNKTDTQTENEVETKDLFKTLPKISSKEYIGTDICRICMRKIRSNHRAVSCDGCEWWMHIKCSDMEKRTYNLLKDKRSFNWTCHYCRDTEVLSTSRIDLLRLKPEECPKSIDELLSDEKPLILNINCRSIINKVDELKDICYKLKPIIVCLTETWMDQTVPQSYIVPEGYSIIRKDRTDNFKQRYGKANGGGVAILHKKNVKIKLKNIGDKDDEVLWVEVMAKRRFLLGLVYRATYTDILTETEGNTKLNSSLETAHAISDNVILVGDLNCDTESPNPDNITKSLLEICSVYQLTQMITTPTRIAEDSKTTIDHIWADKNKDLIHDSGTFMGISDHFGTYAMLNTNLRKETKKSKLRRNWRNYNVSEYRETLSRCIEESNIDDLINLKDINGSLQALTEAIQCATNQHAPMIEVKERNKEKNIPWFNKEIAAKKEEKNKLLKLYYLLRDPSDKAKARKLNNEINHMKEKKKKAYYTDKLEKSEGDPKQTWDILKELTNGYTAKDDIEPDNMTQEESNKYNDYFATVGSEIQKKLNIKNSEVTTKQTGFTFTPESEESIMKLIDRIRTNVAVGNDGINAKVLKDAKDVIAPTLAKIINTGYDINKFPDQLKIASIKPVHKKNCPNEPANYRPISILPILSKVFERSAVDQLVKYLEKNNLLTACQHAYRRGHSTTTCLAEITNKIYKSLDNGLIVGVASMDLSKAFDAISHTHLLQKLSNMGLHEDSVKWIESYLESRKQKTKFKNFTSEESIVTSGVPQGSILGPILFLCFTNDLTNDFPEDKVVSYADDSQFIVTGMNMGEVKKKLENIVMKAEKWYKVNSLMSNPSKTEVIIFTKRKHNTIPVISILENNQEINLEVKSEVKVLGVLIDKNLTWDTHITKLRNKTTGIVRHLHKVNKLLPMKSKLQLYDSLVASHLSYADIIWSGCSQANKQKLQCVQNFAFKSILGMKKFDSATQALTTLKHLNLEEKRNIHEAVFTHKVQAGKMPSNLTEDYKNLQPRLQHRSAAQGTLNIPKHTTTKYENSVLYRTIKSWNKTSPSIRTENTATFKKKLQSQMITEKYLTN